MKIEINNTIKITGLPLKYKNIIKKTLRLNNPKFHMMKRMGKSIWGMKPEIKYYSDKDGVFEIPRGMKTRLITYLNKNSVQYELEEDYVETQAEQKKMSNNILLRPYQAPLVKNLCKSTEGMLDATVGSGKTIIMLEVIHRLGLTATILVPNKTLLANWELECKKFLDYQPGLIHGGYKEVKDITISTFQSLYTTNLSTQKKKVVNQLVNNTSILICDEAHGTITKENKKVISRFNPKHIYGCSGTCDREDGQGKAINFFFGNTVARHEAQQLKPLVEIMKSKTKIPVLAQYNEMIDEMIDNKSRNTLINGLIVGEILQGKKILVLTKRIQHYRNLEKQMCTVDGVYYIDSKDPERNDKLMMMKQGLMDFNVIFGTTNLLAQGTDIPTLDTLIIACDLKSKILTTQSAGRILRIFKGKNDPKIIDIVDNYNPILNRQALSRQSLYRQKKWEIKYIN